MNAKPCHGAAAIRRERNLKSGYSGAAAPL
jgi:hypothetical protein